ncbi:hypothetical protein M899_2697 [Bacteriovorax sp. BSW11_IV]|nr:hypothetical protein M899_2697 [Bacteriovorax sp. BSW11_IV]
MSKGLTSSERKAKLGLKKSERTRIKKFAISFYKSWVIN